jgi:transposase
MKNKFVSRAKISEEQFKRIIELFALDLDASQISKITGINRNTINRYVKEIRLRIWQYCQLETATTCPVNLFNNAIPAYATACAALSGDISFLGIANDNGKIRSLLIPEPLCRKLKEVCSKKKRNQDCPIDEALQCFDCMIDLPKMKYVRLKPGEKAGEHQRNDIDICSGFWGLTRSRLHRFRGLKKSTVLLHIKESEFRYNYHRNDLLPLLLHLFEERPLFH